MKNLGRILVGHEDSAPFEQRLFHSVMLLGIAMTVFGTVMDIYYKAPIAMDLLFAVCWGAAYCHSRFLGKYAAVVAVSSAILVFAFIPYLWITSGGSGTIIPIYLIAFIAYLCTVTKGRFRLAMVTSMMVVTLFLLARDAYLAGSVFVAIPTRMTYFDFSIQLCVIVVAVAVLVIVYSNAYQREKARSEAYGQTVEEQYRQQFYYMQNLEKLNFRLKSERHDFNNHLGVMYALLESGDALKAKEYAAQLVQTAEEYQNIVHIPYPALRAMLNYKLSVARETGIALRLDVALEENLPLNEFDLTVMLGNLLDNATEACADCDAQLRYIALSLQYKPDYIVIRMENPTKKRSITHKGKIRTTKADAQNHGFGLRNIEHLVQKHNGLMKIEQEKEVFSVHIAMLFPSKNA